MAAAYDITAARTARAEVEQYLEANQRKSLLRFITCGSVDDGKSTLIGRLLYDSKMLFEDQLAALASDSRKMGTQGEALDFALLVDGLGAEREQGITIDVAYRFFATDKRKFIVADTPGHEQYTRNMVTGASTADLAVILIDARKGVLTQTRRHSYLVHLLGIRSIVLAVNKMDLVGYDQARFDEIVADYRAFAAEVGIADFTAIPLSGLAGDNVSSRSDAMPWHDGPSLIEHLETVPVGAGEELAPFRMAVQWVNRPNSSFRGYAGRIASGGIKVGDRITVLPSGHQSRVERIATMNGDLDEAIAGQSVTLTFTDEVDCSRGDTIATAPSTPVGGLSANLVWMSDEALVPGRSYWLKMGAQTLSASVDAVRHVVDVNSMARQDGRPLALNDIGLAELRLDRAVPAIAYAESRELGGFILIDKISHATVAAGMVTDFLHAAESVEPVDDASRITWVAGATKAERAGLAGKHEQQLRALGRTVLVLDEAALREGIASDVAEGDTPELARRAREVAKLAAGAGGHVLITLDVDKQEAHPGRRIDAGHDSDEGTDEWVI